MNKLAVKMTRTVTMLLAVALLGGVLGCVEGKTPSEKFHSRMRAKPVPMSEFLPNHELLVKQPNTFPFHYFYLKEQPKTYNYIYVERPDFSQLKKGKGWTKMDAKLIEKIGKGEESLSIFTHDAFVEAFGEAAKEGDSNLQVTDNKDQPGTLVLEPAIIAIKPTKAELNVIGTTASFFVFGPDILASMLAEGSVSLECRVRDAKTREIIAMYSNTETDPTALIPVAGYSWTASSRINIKEMAKNTAKVLGAKDYRTIKRRFPIRFVTLLRDSNIDKEYRSEKKAEKK